MDNIGFGLNLKKVDKSVIEQKVKRMLKMVGLEGFEKRDVTLLSGGQQQRVAIARALVNEPKVLLLDEPLGALDAKIRKQMQIELKKIQREVGITFIYVTHDQEEALSMSDTVVVMNNGEIQQIGSPTDIYNEPENRFVAGFIGESNIIEGIMIRDFLVEFDGFRFECVDKGFEDNEAIEVVLARRIWILWNRIRPRSEERYGTLRSRACIMRSWSRRSFAHTWCTLPIMQKWDVKWD